MTNTGDPIAEFMVAACVPRDSSHSSGTLDRARAILAAHPEVANADIHTAAILGDDAAVKQFLADNAADATAKGGPHGWDALTHLCFSRYLRLDKTRSAGFVRAAAALLDSGANANSGWYENDHLPHPEWESVLYGAAGIARHAELTSLLLDRGADPNDGEVTYHAPEGWDNDALKALVECGKLNQDSLATMLLRKADWHDPDGIKYLLEHGADPNRMTHWHYTAFHQAVRRDNGLANIEAMLDHGADPTLENEEDGRSAIAMAARRGRGDILELFEKRGVPITHDGVDRLIAACARSDAAEVRSMAAAEPHLVGELIALGGDLLGTFVGTGNLEGVRHLLDLGVDVRTPYAAGDGYFGVARNSLPIHVAAWRARPAIVRLLIDRGSPVDVPDGRGRSPLALAVKSCVDSYWTERRSPESVEALLKAGASVTGVECRCGYAEVDELLRSHRK